MPQPKEKTDSIESVFSFGRSIGASRLAPQGVAVAELGSHFASKAMGARSQEPRAKIFAQRANILVFAKRCGVRFAFAACRSRRGAFYMLPKKWADMESAPTVEARRRILAEGEYLSAKAKPQRN